MSTIVATDASATQYDSMRNRTSDVVVATQQNIKDQIEIVEKQIELAHNNMQETQTLIEQLSVTLTLLNTQYEVAVKQKETLLDHLQACDPVLALLNGDTKTPYKPPANKVTSRVGEEAAGQILDNDEVETHTE